MKNKHNNSINTINIFKKDDSWVFNDSEVDLLEEPFVAGADTLLDILSKGSSKINVTFSSIQFPGSTLTLEYQEGKINQGTYYKCKELNHVLWLCPALGKYFKKSPKTIFVEYK